MNRYVEYIEDLLYLHDCVILPGFGGFICNYTAATIDHKKGVCTPPAKIVVFNKHLSQNDGLLIHWIAQKEGMDYEKAQRGVTLFCEELKVHLNQKQKIDFGQIGTFQMDKHFQIQFESSRHNFLPESMGMGTIEVMPLTNVQDKKEMLVPTNHPVYRLLKYGLSAAVIAGIVVISQQDIFKSLPSIDMAQIFPSSAKVMPREKQAPIISPDYDFVDFEPSASLPTENSPR